MQGPNEDKMLGGRICQKKKGKKITRRTQFVHRIRMCEFVQQERKPMERGTPGKESTDNRGDVVTHRRKGCRRRQASRPQVVPHWR